MDILEVLDQVRELLQQKGRVTYRILKRQFALDDEALEELKEQLIDAEEVAVDKDGKMLEWTGGETSEETASQTADAPAVELPSSAPSAQPEREAPAGERRQLTVMFCDLVGSTPLAEKLDPEELRQVILAYQDISARVIEQFEGYLARYVGDGLLVYFGYPLAHDNEGQRAVQAGLGIVTAVQELNRQLCPTVSVLQAQPLQVRIGIHTGLVVVGEMGGGRFRDPQAIVGETPNIAARLQGRAEPDTLMISAATYRLVEGLFECRDWGLQALKGVSTPLRVYQVRGESEVGSRFEVAVRAGLTPLVGRDEELGFLLKRWERAKVGEGQVVLLSGEPGIGKSRLIQELKEQLGQEETTQIEFRCSPYHQNSALYPVIAHLQRRLQFERNESVDAKLAKLQQTLSGYQFPQADTMPLLAALLSLPHPEGVLPITLSPQEQKEKTQEALVAWLVEETVRTPVYISWEDLHWADPSTLEVLGLLFNQVPTTHLLAVLTFRPEFVPPWSAHSYLSQLTLSRLGQTQVSEMVARVMGGKPLPEEVVQQIVAKTDGVPLFVEELTKTVVESGLIRVINNHYELTGSLSVLSIPSTLQDSLMARLDRLASAKEVAQLGATIGREFSYEVLQAIASRDGATLQHGLKQLVDAELVYQSGLPPDARYRFKHALVQDTAYQSLLKSTRQQVHQQIAHVLKELFLETTQTQPELLAHHYTEAGLSAQAIPYWQQAGQRASQRSAYAEATAHLTMGLELLQALPSTPWRAQQELTLQIILGEALMATRGVAAPEVEHAYARARELCQQVGETPQLFQVLVGLCAFYQQRSEFQTAQELAEQLLHLAQSMKNSLSYLWAHLMLGTCLHYLGRLAPARDHLEQSLAFSTPQQHRSYSLVHAPRVSCLSRIAHVLYLLGYPDQALKRSQEALSQARKLSCSFSAISALSSAAGVHRMRGEQQAAQELQEAHIALSNQQGFAQEMAIGTILQGQDLAEQGQGEEGIAQIRRGLAAYQATGPAIGWLLGLTLLAEIYGKAGQPEEGLSTLAEVLRAVHKTGRRDLEADLYRLKGELTLQASGQNPGFHIAEAESCFHQALEIARQQGAKYWELRASTSLARLWQQQGKRTEARDLLAPVYEWFTEGFDTKDLQEAKALLEELS